MRILITTGLSKADIGGPFQYAHHLEEEFKSLGHQVMVIAYGERERSLPPWIRHFYFLSRIVKAVWWSDKILTLDTYSVGIPTLFMAKILGKRVTARVGGDFLWSAHINRTKHPITLPAFYADMPTLNMKEKLIFFFMGNMIRRTDYLAFNTEWQKNIWDSFYKIRPDKSGVVRNYIPERKEGRAPQVKNILWVGRAIPEKNIEMLKNIGSRLETKYPQSRVDIVTGIPHEEVLERLKDCYAATTIAFSDISPNFIIEAISFNKPFIMTRETGLSELFPKGGIFVNPLEGKEVEAAMEAMLDDNTYNRCVDELKDIKVTHPWSELAEEFLSIWKSL